MNDLEKGIRETIETMKRKFEGFLAGIEHLMVDSKSDRVVLVNLGAQQKEEVREAIITMKGVIKGEAGMFSDEFAYLFKYPFETGKPFHISKGKGNSFLSIWTSIKFTQEHYRVFQGLSDRGKKKIIDGLHEITIEKDLELNFYIKPTKIIYEICDIYLYEDIFEPISVRLLHKKIQKILGCLYKTIFFLERELFGDYPVDLTQYIRP